MSPRIPLYNRRSQAIEYEQVFEDKVMDFLYGTRLGLFLEKTILSKSVCSMIYGLLQDRASSTEKIPAFIEAYGVDVTELEDGLESFNSFNDFFKRRLKSTARPINQEPEVLISPCDGRMLSYEVDEELVIPVKGKSFTLFDLLQDKLLAQQYRGGTCLVFRLAPVDYHRFCYLDSGSQSKIKSINGVLHSVSPLSLHKLIPVFTENYREYTTLATDHFGEVLHIDVGALVVGKINQHEVNGAAIVRGQEKGYFEFGGSTIISLFKQGRVVLDEDLIEQSLAGVESLVRMGERIGEAIESLPNTPKGFYPF